MAKDRVENSLVGRLRLGGDPDGGMGDALRAWCEQSQGRDTAGLNSATELAVRRILRLARERLGTEITWLSRVYDDHLSLDFLDGDGERFGATEGMTTLIKDSYFARVMDGRLPAIVPDTRANEHARDLPATRAFRVGAYVGVPVLLRDGRVYGILFCANDYPTPTFHPRDAATMSILADMVADLIEPYFDQQQHAIQFRAEAQAALDADAPWAVLQPIVETATARTIAAEALARFPAGRYNTEQWFDAARLAGCGTELETDALHAALALLPKLPADVRLAVNASADMISSGHAAKVLVATPPDRVIVEVTERHRSDDVTMLVDAVTQLRAQGNLIAIDDAGSGYSSLHQILELAPDIVKLDRNLVTGIDHDPMKRAMCRAFVTFTDEAGILLVAEGVETADELGALETLGVRHVQGYYVGRPQRLVAA